MRCLNFINIESNKLSWKFFFGGNFRAFGLNSNFVEGGFMFLEKIKAVVKNSKQKKCLTFLLFSLHSYFYESTFAWKNPLFFNLRKCTFFSVKECSMSWLNLKKWEVFFLHPRLCFLRICIHIDYHLFFNIETYWFVFLVMFSNPFEKWNIEKIKQSYYF